MKQADLDPSFHCGDSTYGGISDLYFFNQVQLVFPSLSAQIQKSCYKMIPLILLRFYLLIRIGGNFSLC